MASLVYHTYPTIHCVQKKNHLSRDVARTSNMWQHVARQQGARSGNMLPVSRRHNYYSFMSRSTCIFLYQATSDEQQTGNNFVADIQATS